MNALSATWTSIAPALGNHLWQSTLFAAIAALLALTLRNYQARTRYWLWLAASVKFLIPFSLLLSIGSHLAWRVHPATSQPAMYATLDQLSQPFTETTLPATLTLPIPAHPSTLLPAVLATIWLCGFITVLAFWCIQLRQVSKTIRKAKPLQSGREIKILRQLEQMANLRNPIKLLSSPRSMEPGVVGILRPILLWPEGISHHLNDAHLEAILAHEVCHVQRHDNLTSAIHMLVESLFWFHPLVWWLEKQLIQERERACDEQVLQLGKQPQIYAESILKVCELCIESPLTCISGITGADLKKRIVRIMTGSIGYKLSLGRKLLLTVIGITAVAGPVMFGLVNITSIHAQLLHATDIPVPSFEVATIRPSSPDAKSSSLEITAAGFSVQNLPLKNVIKLVYGVKADEQFFGAPGWTDRRFDINAKIEQSQAEALNKLPPPQRFKQVELMVQSLLADRFKLKVSFQTKQIPVYAIVIAKNGPKLKQVEVSPPPAPGEQRVPGSSLPTMKGTRGRLDGNGASIGSLAEWLSMQSEFGDRVVIDATGLKGNYDFTLQWTPVNGADGGQEPANASSPGPSLFTAIQEQLGLKLQSQKGPVEVLVIDHIEPPSEN